MNALRVLVLIALALAATVAAVEEEVQIEDEPDVEDVVDVEAEQDARSIGQARTLTEWSNAFWRWMGYDYDYYDDYDNYYYSATGAQYGYGLPSVGYLSPTAGGPQSSYSSYVPVQIGHSNFDHPARDDNYEDNDWSLTDMMFDMAITAIPVGLLLSALPTGLFTFAIRRRSFDDSSMLIDTLEPEEITRITSLLKSDLTDRRCQEELFCEISRIGEKENASYLQKSFYYISTLTPDFLAGRFGLGRLFRTTRSGYCQALQCPSTSLLLPPQIKHHPTDTNHIAEIVSDNEKEAVEVSKE